MYWISQLINRKYKINKELGDIHERANISNHGSRHGESLWRA